MHLRLDREPPSQDYQTAGFAVLVKKLAQAVAEEAARHPELPIKLWSTDEHRLGLKPIRRRVWAPKGQRPLALGHYRDEWLYVTAFVQPGSGETFWYLSSGISKPFFQALLAMFAEESGAGRARIIVLTLDNAGWHTAKGLQVPQGLRLVHLPPYSPELRPAERLWGLVDEPLVNAHFATLSDLEALCCTDGRCGRTEPCPCPGSHDADVFRASQFQHTVQGTCRNRYLARLTPVRLRA